MDLSQRERTFQKGKLQGQIALCSRLFRLVRILPCSEIFFIGFPRGGHARLEKISIKQINAAFPVGRKRFIQCPGEVKFIGQGDDSVQTEAFLKPDPKLDISAVPDSVIPANVFQNLPLPQQAVFTGLQLGQGLKIVEGPAALHAPAGHGIGIVPERVHLPEDAVRGHDVIAVDDGYVSAP